MDPEGCTLNVNHHFSCLEEADHCKCPKQRTVCDTLLFTTRSITMAKVLRAVNNALYEVDIRDIRSSVATMDIFEGKRSPHIRYKTMLIKRALRLKLNSNTYIVSLLITRERPETWPHGRVECLANTTFTELREWSKPPIILQDVDPDQYAQHSMMHPILKTIKQHSRQHSIDVGIGIPLAEPLVFNAQTSDNRTGYGDEWRFGECISVGTNYGETTQYYISKLSIDRA